MRTIGERISQEGTPSSLGPFVIGVTGQVCLNAIAQNANEEFTGQETYHKAAFPCSRNFLL